MNDVTTRGIESCHTMTVLMGGLPRYFLVSLSIVLCLSLPACIAFGPKRMPADRFNYGEAIARSWDEQLLHNLVRSRYLQMPTFLEVGSVLTQYTYTGNIGVQGAAGSSMGFGTYAAGGSVNLGYTERPTITYTPLTGSEFSRRLLTPLSIDAVFSLGQSGWPIDQLLLIGLQRLNDVQNMSFGGITSPDDLARLHTFRRVLWLLHELEKSGAIEVQRHQNQTPGGNSLVFTGHPSPDTQQLIDEFKRTLDLDPQRNVFRITKRLTERQPDEISIQMRSLLAMMFFLARGVEPPAQHLREKRLVPMPRLADQQANATLFPLRVRTQPDRPEDAFIAIRHRGHWFYVEDTDHTSKRTIALLTVLFRLLAPDKPAAAPILTLPVGP